MGHELTDEEAVRHLTEYSRRWRVPIPTLASLLALEMVEQMAQDADVQQAVRDRTMRRFFAMKGRDDAPTTRD